MTAFTVAIIIKSLDTIHDLLHPFFKDEDNIEDLNKILKKLEDLEK